MKKVRTDRLKNSLKSCELKANEWDNHVLALLTLSMLKIFQDFFQTSPINCDFFFKLLSFLSAEHQK